MNKLLVPMFGIVVSATACVSTSYYQSPMHANSNFYKTAPLHSDPVKSATYVGAGFGVGGANDAFRDVLLDFNATVHQAHNFGMFQGYYGITGAIGTYNVGDDDVSEGSKPFSSWETSGGLSVVVPFSTGGEWRLGGELSYSREYGDYLDFRRKIPDVTVRLNDTRNYHFTLGAYSDLLFKGRKNVIGYKFSPGMNLNYIDGVDAEGIYRRRRTYYLMHVLHFQRDKLTCFVQGQIGSYTFVVQSGVNVRLGR